MQDYSNFLLKSSNNCFITYKSTVNIKFRVFNVWLFDYVYSNNNNNNNNNNKYMCYPNKCKRL